MKKLLYFLIISFFLTSNSYAETRFEKDLKKLIVDLKKLNNLEFN